MGGLLAHRGPDGTDLLVNTTVAGSGHKVVFEAMARGRLALASNRPSTTWSPVYRWSCRSRRPTIDHLAARIVAYAGLSVGTRLAVAVELRRRIETSHSLDGWADPVVGTLCK